MDPWSALTDAGLELLHVSSPYDGKLKLGLGVASLNWSGKEIWASLRLEDRLRELENVWVGGVMEVELLSTEVCMMVSVAMVRVEELPREKGLAEGDWEVNGMIGSGEEVWCGGLVVVGGVMVNGKRTLVDWGGVGMLGLSGRDKGGLMNCCEERVLCASSCPSCEFTRLGWEV